MYNVCDLCCMLSNSGIFDIGFFRNTIVNISITKMTESDCFAARQEFQYFCSGSVQKLCNF